MPYILEDLIINRVDLVDEGANSAAFIELYKRKEQSAMELKDILSKLKPEHAEVVQAAIDKGAADLQKAKDDLTAVTAERDQAKADLAKAEKELEDAKEDSKDDTEKTNAFDEDEVIKGMPEATRKLFEKMKSQKDAAEAELLKAKDAEKTAEAVAKAKELKAIPVEQEKLVGIIKSASPEMLDLLTIVNAAIEGTVLDEVGKSHNSGNDTDAWTKIEAKADEIAKRDNITKAKAISKAIRENPDLYKEYLQGGAN